MQDIAVRPFQPDEWPAYKRIRLQALATDPHVFGSNLAKEEAHPDTHWQSALQDPAIGIFGVYAQEVLVGMTGVALKRDDPTGRVCVLWGSWLQPDFRKKGFSTLMYQARLDWARAHPTVQRVIVSHRASNLASMHANQKHGFVKTHVEDHIWLNDEREPQIFYVLELPEK
jgi:RimJ/RimL family protein N-acetyltransferase